MAQVPQKIAEFGAWEAFTYTSDAGKNCYIAAVPSQMEPASVNHGDNFFLVSQKPGGDALLEPQAMLGYALKESSKVDVEIDGKTFTFFTKDNVAWAEDASQEPQVISAMKAGVDMQVNATSQRGTATSYKFSLKGVTAALNEIQDCK